MFTELLNWSRREYADLPWRQQRSLYTTLVSEIMLQQTTVPTVMNHYHRFLKRFPDLESLGKATFEEVCIQWKGLGYYRRAKMLQAACAHLTANHQGLIPLDRDQLMGIPGIGIYTASAILAIGANQRALPVDANLERVLARIFLIDGEKGLRLKKKIHLLFEQKKLLPDLDKWGPRDLSEALMDLGRTYCKANKTHCDECPVKASCLAHQNKIELFVNTGPGKNTNTNTNKKEKAFNLSLLRFWIIEKNCLLTYRKRENQWLSGQWEVPTFILESEDKSLKQYPQLAEVFTPKQLQKFSLEKVKAQNPCCRTGITKYKIDNYVVKYHWSDFQKLIGSRKTSGEEEIYQFVELNFHKNNLASNILKIQKVLE